MKKIVLSLVTVLLLAGCSEDDKPEPSAIQADQNSARIEIAGEFKADEKGMVKITGKTEPRAVVTIFQNGKEKGRTTAGKDGHFSLELKNIPKNTTAEYVVKVTNGKKNGEKAVYITGPEYVEVDPKEPAETKETSTETYSYVGNGEDGVITRDGFVAVTEDDMEEFYDYAIANNNDALNRMVLRGQIFPVKKGTEITVIDRGFLKAEIEIIDTGQRGFVPVEMIGK